MLRECKYLHKCCAAMVAMTAAETPCVRGRNLWLVQLQALPSEQLLKVWAINKKANLAYLTIEGKNPSMINTVLHE